MDYDYDDYADTWYDEAEVDWYEGNGCEEQQTKIEITPCGKGVVA